MSKISIRVGIPPKQWEVDGLHETHRIWRDKQALLEQENVALKAQLAAHAEVVERLKKEKAELYQEAQHYRAVLQEMRDNTPAGQPQCWPHHHWYLATASKAINNAALAKLEAK